MTDFSEFPLFDPTLRTTIATPNVDPDEKSPEVKFWDFHRDNPHVYEELMKLATGLMARGHRRYGIAGLFEVLRYRHAMRTLDPNESFRLNNNYRAYYARLIMKREPRFVGFFETRKQKTR